MSQKSSSSSTTSSSTAASNSFLGSCSNNNNTPIWSGHVLWANYLLELNIFPRSRNAHLSEWGGSQNSIQSNSNNHGRNNGEQGDLLVSLQIFYSKPSFSSFITEEIKNAFFGDASVRQSVHIVMKKSVGSSSLLAHLEGSKAFILGFVLIPAQRSESSLYPPLPLRPLVIDLKSDSLVRSGDYFYFKAWILNETSILTFFRFVSLKTESDEKLQELFTAHQSLGRPLEWPPTHYTSPSGPLLYSQELQATTTFYDNLQKLQNEYKYAVAAQSIVQRACSSSSTVIKPIPMYPSTEPLNFMSEQKCRKTGKQLELSPGSMFKPSSAETQSNRSSHFTSHRAASSSLFHQKSPNPYTSLKETSTRQESNAEALSGRIPYTHKTTPAASTLSPSSSSSSLSSKGPWKSLSPSLHEKCLSEFINTLFTLQEEPTQTLDLMDKIIPLLIGCEGEDVSLLDKVHDLFRTFYKGQKNLQSHEYEKWNVKIELQFSNTLKRCPYNFRQDLATHFLKERDILILKMRKKDKKKQLSETIVRSEEYKLKKKTIGVFSGNFNDNVVHFSTIILENASASPPSVSSISTFSNLYCLFISKDIPFFTWDKWKDSNATLTATSSKMSISFDLEDWSSKTFNLNIQCMEGPDDFHEHISLKKGSNEAKKACLISFTNFYNYFQKVEKVYKVEPLITWKPIIFSPTNPSKETVLKRSKEQDPFYGLLMSVFGNRVYGLSYRKRIKLKFEFQEKRNISYHALIFNNNIVFISERTTSGFLQEIDNLIFGCETFETFLIKNERIPTSGNSVLKLKIPITSRKVDPLRDSAGNSTSIIPSVLVKAKILGTHQLESFDFLKKEILDGESFIVERKGPLLSFQESLRGHIKLDEASLVASSMDFRMMRKIRTIAKIRILMRGVHHDLIVFYFISFLKSEGSEMVFVHNQENEVIGRSINVLVSPLSENILRLISKSNFSSSVLLTRKDKSTWAMITDVNEPLRCIGRIVMLNAYKSIIWEAIESRDMFFSDLENIHSAFSSMNCLIKSWVKIYGLNDDSFTDFHPSEEGLESWDNSLDAPSCGLGVREESKKMKARAHKRSREERLKEGPEEVEQGPKSPQKRLVETEKSPPESRAVETMETQAMPLKKRIIRPHSPSSTISSCSSFSPPLTIDMEAEDSMEHEEEGQEEEEGSGSGLIPKVIINEKERIEAEQYLHAFEPPPEDNGGDEEVIDAIQSIVDDIEQNDKPN